MTAYDEKGAEHRAIAINEVSLFRQIYQAAKLRISVDGRVRLHELICDGVLVPTPAGSTAYNLSAHGPILPINAPLMVLTPISPFRPRRWRGAILPNEAVVLIEVLEPDKRPVSAVADNTEFRDVLAVEIREASDVDIFMMFDPGHSLAERILREQFDYWGLGSPPPGLRNVGERRPLPPLGLLLGGADIDEAGHPLIVGKLERFAHALAVAVPLGDPLGTVTKRGGGDQQVLTRGPGRKHLL